MKNTVFPHKFWRPFLDCMPQLFFRPQYVWFPVHLKGHLIPLCYETLVVNWQNWLFTLFHQSRSVLSPNPIHDSHNKILQVYTLEYISPTMFICIWSRTFSKILNFMHTGVAPARDDQRSATLWSLFGMRQCYANNEEKLINYKQINQKIRADCSIIWPGLFKCTVWSWTLR